MTQPYRQNFAITDIHLDCFGRVKPSVLLYFAQEVAGAHAKILGTDWDTLNEKGLFWAIIRHSIQIERLPMSGETITLETWPMPTTRVAYPRATVAYDENGNVLFRTMALWVLMDTGNRTMILPGKSGVTVEGILQGGELPTPGSLPAADLPNCLYRTVGYAELDRNLHMNNTRYLDWVDDLLPSRFHKEHPAAAITVCYLAETLEGQELALRWLLTEEGLLSVDAYREKEEMTGSQERVFAARVQYKS